VKAVVQFPTRIITGDASTRSVHPGDMLEGLEAAEAVASGTATLLEEGPAAPTEPAAVPVEPEVVPEAPLADEPVNPSPVPEPVPDDGA
jgi:hypothetical protein